MIINRLVNRLAQDSCQSRFLLVTHGQNGRYLPVEAVQNDIAAVSKVDQPFPTLRRHIVDRSADVGLMREDLHS